MTALARKHDPETSRAAAQGIAAVADTIRAEVLRAIVAAGPAGATLDEIIDATGIDKVTVSPRLKPMETDGLIGRLGTRAGKAGKQQTIWISTGVNRADPREHYCRCGKWGSWGFKDRFFCGAHRPGRAP